MPQPSAPGNQCASVGGVRCPEMPGPELGWLLYAENPVAPYGENRVAPIRRKLNGSFVPRGDTHSSPSCQGACLPPWTPAEMACSGIEPLRHPGSLRAPRAPLPHAMKPERPCASGGSVSPLHRASTLFLRWMGQRRHRDTASAGSGTLAVHQGRQQATSGHGVPRDRATDLADDSETRAPVCVYD